ncbi:hypothetical protein SD36_09535 [Corynebacterium glutamicum]|nr:hypothetical protein SD36_09535 [Corynebacterium glutamicum]
MRIVEFFLQWVAQEFGNPFCDLIQHDGVPHTCGSIIDAFSYVDGAQIPVAVSERVEQGTTGASSPGNFTNFYEL